MKGEINFQWKSTLPAKRASSPEDLGFRKVLIPRKNLKLGPGEQTHCDERPRNYEVLERRPRHPAVGNKDFE